MTPRKPHRYTSPRWTPLSLTTPTISLSILFRRCSVPLHLYFHIYNYCIAVRHRSSYKRSGIVEQKGVSLFKRNSSGLQNYGKYSKPPNCLSFFCKKNKKLLILSSGCFAKMIIYSKIMPMYQLFSKTIFLLRRETPFCSTIHDLFYRSCGESPQYNSYTY